MSMCRNASLIAFFFCASSALAADPPVADSGPFASGQVIQAEGSGTVASRVLQKASFQKVTDQIRFDVQVIRVDNETRDKIYGQLGVANVQTEITKVDESTAHPTVDGGEETLGSHHKTTTGSIVTTAVMDREQHQAILDLVKQGESCSVVAQPRMIAGGGQVAAIQQQVQRPFLADLKEVQTGDHTGVHSGIQVLNEGIDFVVQGDVDGEGLQVRTKIEQSKVVDVTQHKVYGIGEGPKVIQIPTHEVKVASASERLLPKQTLLLDPYFQSVEQQHSTVGTPILDKVPYLNRSFKQTSVKSVTTHLIVLVKAKKL
jgi:type II secretory pathway component GspD/PulD (secretin)